MVKNRNTVYRSLNEIRERKEDIDVDIKKDKEKIRTMWRTLTKPSEAFNHSATPSQRIMGWLNTGAGIFDGLILGWKLYRKFRKR